MMRIYSFAPEINESRPYASLERLVRFESWAGSRKLDMYIDIPAPAELEIRESHES